MKALDGKQKLNFKNSMNENLLAGFDNEEIKTIDGYDSCIVGVVERFGQPPIVCYDKEKIIQKLIDNGMDCEKANEFFCINYLGYWVGDGTPCFLSKSWN